MYYHPYMYVHPYYVNQPIDNYNRQQVYWTYPKAPANKENHNAYWEAPNKNARIVLKDYGKQPYVVNIEDAAEQNKTFRTALWTGEHLQVTLMRIGVGEDIGLEVHPTVDQFLRIEEGQGVVRMGNTESNLVFQRNVEEDDAIMVPAGTWHNLINTSNKPLKLYSIYAPPEHPAGTVHVTKTDAMAADEKHGH